MKRWTETIAPLASVVVMSVSLGLGAAQAADPAKDGGMQASDPDKAAASAVGQLIRTGAITGKEIRNVDGQKLGKVDQFVIDGKGDVQYVIVGYGGMFGIGDKYTAVPWDAVDVSEDGQSFTLDIDQERFAQAPTFGKEDWPELAKGSDFSKEVGGYFDTTGGQPLAQEQDAPVPLSQQMAKDTEARDAPEGEEQLKANFSELDTDGDGTLSREEAKAAQEVQARFDQADEDKDGSLTDAEFAAFWPGHVDIIPGTDLKRMEDADQGQPGMPGEQDTGVTPDESLAR